MKVCSVCGVDKPFSEYYLRKDTGKPCTGRCKVCHKEKVKENRDENLEYYRDYDKSRNNLSHRVEARKEYAKTEIGAQNVQKAKDSYIKRNPKIRIAHSAVSNAIRDGKLIRASNCESCRAELFTEAHHCDYNKPLEVLWLCDRCHKDWHLNNDPIY